MKHIAAIGGYFIMLYDIFRKRTRWSITKDLILREIDDLIFGSIGIVAFISFFVGGVVAVQTALNIDSPFIPKYLSLSCLSLLLLLRLLFWQVR